jgi:uncharacterized membrane protein HdeD (DUF308 family)
MTYTPPWKLAVVGMVAILAGVALVLVDWQVSELAKFVAMLFIARAALHIVTTQFEGVEGGLAGALAGGELTVGTVLLVWPSPTLLVVGVVVGALAVLHAAIAGAIIAATRTPHTLWKLRLVSCVLEFALGVALIARPGGTVRGTAVTLGALAILVGLTEVVTATSRVHTMRLERRAGVTGEVVIAG